MNLLEKIYYNCHRATYLIEKKQLDSIRLKERVELILHLSICPVCRLYQKQSSLINRSIKELIAHELPGESVLDEKFKEALQQKIVNILDKDHS